MSASVSFIVQLVQQNPHAMAAIAMPGLQAMLRVRPMHVGQFRLLAFFANEGVQALGTPTLDESERKV